MLHNVKHVARMTDIIVCGCCTADATHQAVSLKRRLDRLCVPHDLVEVHTHNGLECDTPCKPLQIRDAMDRHPGKTILFIDVACRIVGTRDDLVRAADIAGDIALHARLRVCSSGTPVLTLHAETLVLRPTAKAHVFIGEWIGTWKRGARSGSDHDMLTVALAGVPELSVTLLGAEFCATQQDKHPLPVILHERVGADVKAAGAMETLMRWIRPRQALS